MTRRIRREDPAYLAAMREAKAMFDAEMAKSAMKSRGRPAAAAAAPAPTPELVADDPDVLLDDVAEIADIDAAAGDAVMGDAVMGDAVTGDDAAGDDAGDDAPAPKAPGGRGRRAGDAKKR